ncbi:hypothetical protein NKI15_22465 [Mesorhizobium sp. M0862]
MSIRSRACAWSVNHRIGYVDLAWAIGREVDGKKIIWPKYVVDHLMAQW